jgi:predicted ATPase
VIESISTADIATYAKPAEALCNLSRINFVFGSNGTGKTTVIAHYKMMMGGAYVEVSA